ncbi:MAG TPA: hypothetical protein VNT53_08075 [Pseudolysinimonas sp.]|nr:hypothetical protein [Pseudolysinimonas sp.]
MNLQAPPAVAGTENYLSSEDILRNVKSLGTLIEQDADETNQTQRLTPRVKEALAAAGAFRIGFPASWGGPEMRLDDQIRMIESIAYHDASTSWNVMVLADGGFFAPQLPREVAREIFTSLDFATAGSTRPAGKAVRVEGGYKLTGHWSFGSGVRNADIITGAFYLYDDADGGPDLDEQGNPSLHICFVPVDAVELFDAWYTTGLSGSGSTEYAVTDVFVPHDWMYGHSATEGSLDAPPLVRHADAIVVNQAGVVLGIASRAIDEFRRVVEKPSRLAAGAMKETDPYVPRAYAEAVALRDAARAYAYSTSGEISDLLFAGESLSREQEGSILTIAYLSMKLCRQSLEVLMECLGSRSVLASLPFDRLYRDMSTAARHGNFRAKALEGAGALMLDLPAPAYTIV